MEIRPVLERSDGIKMAIIPKRCDIKKGDTVLVMKLSPKNLSFVNKLMKEESNE